MLLDIVFFYKLADIMNQYHHYETAEPTWSYIDCPPENECLNDHHNCNLRTQKCVDTQEGYDCFCKPGYRQDTGYFNFI